jgi:hypothetical protein
MGPHSLSTLWATILIFNKTDKSKMLFDLAGRIQKHYSYYRKLYNIAQSNFRNDNAFTIADNILNGYTQDPANYIPWGIVTVSDQIDRLELKDKKLYLIAKGQGYVLPKQSLHIISKSYLLSDEYLKLIETATHA